MHIQTNYLSSKESQVLAGFGVLWSPLIENALSQDGQDSWIMKPLTYHKPVYFSSKAIHMFSSVFKHKSLPQAHLGNQNTDCKSVPCKSATMCKSKCRINKLVQAAQFRQVGSLTGLSRWTECRIPCWILFTIKAVSGCGNSLLICSNLRGWHQTEMREQSLHLKTQFL